MPTVTFTARTVAGLKPAPDRVDYFDASLPGFALRISPAGKKTWTVLYRHRGRLRRLTIGTWPTFGLADAREDARSALRDVARGADPATTKREARHADTIETLAAEYIDKHAKPHKRSWKDDRRLLNVEVLPHWRHLTIAELRRRDVRALIEAIAARGAPILGNRVLALVRKMLNFAIERDWIDANPAAHVSRPGAEQRRDRVLSEDEIRQLWTALDAEPAVMAAAFRLRLVTVQRGGEVLGMRWRDVDLDAKVWTIPAEQSKNKLPHRVPLTAPALTILRALRPTDAKPDAYVLVGARGKRQRAAVAQRLGLDDFRGHDLRRTAASCMASAGVPRLVIGKILNHAEPGVTAIYDRHGYDREKTAALETWARTLDGILTQKPGRAAVVPIGRRGR